MEIILGISGGLLVFGLIFLIARLLRKPDQADNTAVLEARAAAERLQSENVELKAKLQREVEARARIEASDDSNDGLKQELQEKEDALRLLEAKLREQASSSAAALQVELAHKEEEIRALQIKLAEAPVASVDNTSELLRMELQRKEEQLRALDTEVRDLRSSAPGDLSDALRRKDEQIEELTDQVTVLTDDLAIARADAARAYENLTKAQEASAAAPSLSNEFNEARIQALQTQLAEREEYYSKLLEERDLTYRDQLSAKDEALRIQLADKDTYVRRTLADREETYRRETAEKDRMIASLIQDKDQSLTDLRDLLENADKKLTATFESLSNRALIKVADELERKTREKFDQVSEQVKFELGFRPEAMSSMLKPFEETMRDLEHRFKESDDKRAAAERILEEQMGRLLGVTGTLSNALRGPGMRGSWTETTLKTVLDNAGLTEKLDYEIPIPSGTGEITADAIIRLPKGRSIVIDTKAPVELYREAMNALDDGVKKQLLADYVRGIRNHIMAVSAKGYWQRYQGVDYVLMFLPADGMYQVAVESDPTLVNDAIQAKIFLVNPMTLVAALRSVSYVLDQERTNQNAAEILEIGGRVYASLRTYAASVARLGTSLKATVETYNESVGSLERDLLANARVLGGKVSSDEALPILPLVDTLPTHAVAEELAALPSVQANSNEPA